MPSATTVINEALADLQVIRPGETASPTTMADCLTRLNQRLSAHSIEQLIAQTQQHTVYTINSGTDRYTFGAGGSLNTASRPEKLVGWRAFSGAFSAGGRVLTFEELQQVSSNPLGSVNALPQAVGADSAYPFINVAIFPASSCQLELTYWSALQQFNNLTDIHILPDGWDDFLHFDLAIALMPRYGRQGFDPTVLASNAQNAKAKIVELNKPTAQVADR